MYAPSRMQQVYRAVLRLGDESADPSAEIDNAYETIVQEWLDPICRAVVGSAVDVVAGEWTDDHTWVTNLPHFAFTSIDTGDRRAMRVVHRDPSTHASWTHNIGFFRAENGVANIDVQTFRGDSQSNGEVHRSVPSCLLSLLNQGRVSDIERIVNGARTIENPEDVHQLVRLAYDIDRRLPLIVISDPTAVDPAALARELYGVAHVFSITPDMSFALSDAVGKDWSVYGGAIRTYRVPFMPERQDRRAHPLALLSSIMQRGVREFTASFVDHVYRNAILDADRFPHFDVLALRQSLLEERKRPVTAAVEPALAPQPSTSPESVEPVAPPKAEPATVVDANEREILLATLAADKIRIAELEAQVAQLQSIAETRENDFYAVLGEFEDYKRLHSDDAISFSALMQIAERAPGSADLKALVSGLQMLVAGVYGAVQDMRSMSSDNESLRQQNFRLRTRVGITPDEEAGAHRAVPEDLRPESVTAYVDQYLAGRVYLHPRALDALDGTPFENPQLVYDTLELIGSEYRNMRLRGESDRGAYERFQERLRELGLTHSASISPTELPKYHPYYHVQHGGQERFLDRHLRNGGNTADPKRCFRCYFFFDDERQIVVVGSLPGHLPNSMS